MKYSLLQDNTNNHFEFKIKLMFVSIHKAYKQLDEDMQRILYVPEILLYLINHYVTDFNFSIKDKRLFVNIIADTIIINYNNFDKNEEDSHIYDRAWQVFFDVIFSNWYLVKQKYKIFFKENGKDIIQFFYINNSIKDHIKQNICIDLIDKLS